MYNAVLENIKSRRSVRNFSDKKIPNELLDLILEAGTYAPTGRNKQSPRIVAVTSEKYRRQISLLNAEVLGVDNDPYYNAPVVILVLADANSHTFVEDGSCVLQNMMLACHSLGLGSVWVHREKEMFDGEKGKALLKEWNLPISLKGVGSIAIGYPLTELNSPSPRKKDYFIKV